MNKIKLKDAQETCAGAADRVVQSLLGWTPADELKVGDIKSIRCFIQNAVFNELDARDLIEK